MSWEELLSSFFLNALLSNTKNQIQKYDERDKGTVTRTHNLFVSIFSHYLLLQQRCSFQMSFYHSFHLFGPESDPHLKLFLTFWVCGFVKLDNIITVADFIKGHLPEMGSKSFGYKICKLSSPEGEVFDHCISEHFVQIHLLFRLRISQNSQTQSNILLNQ